MLDEKGFDTWSKSYDASVKQSDENHQYPFAGYEKVLDAIKQKCLRQNCYKRILQKACLLCLKSKNMTLLYRPMRYII